MNSTSLTQKGQITIPIDVRKRLGLSQGDRVAFIEHEGNIVLKPIKNDVRAAFGLIQTSHSASLDDMDQAIRLRAAESGKA